MEPDRARVDTDSGDTNMILTMRVRDTNDRDSWVKPDEFIIAYNRLYGIDSIIERNVAPVGSPEWTEEEDRDWRHANGRDRVIILNGTEKLETLLTMIWSNLEEHGFHAVLEWVEELEPRDGSPLSLSSQKVVGSRGCQPDQSIAVDTA